MDARTTPRSQPQGEAAQQSSDEPGMAELRQELALVRAQLALQTAEIERLQQVCCPWQACSWHRWPH